MSYCSRRGERAGFSYLGAYHIIAKSHFPFSLRKYFKYRPHKQMCLPYNQRNQWPEELDIKTGEFSGI